MSEEQPPPPRKVPPPLPPRTGHGDSPMPPTPRAAPLPQPSSSLHPADDIGIYQHDRKLIIEQGATIPAICVKCGEPSTHRFRKRYAMSFSGSAKVDVPLCDAHMKTRRVLLAVTWLLFGAMLVTFFYAIKIENGTLGLIGAALLLGTSTVAIVATNYVGIPSRIDRDYVWIKGLNRRFLDQLPPFV